VGKFADDSVLVHRGLHCSCPSDRDKFWRPIFWQHGIAVFAASLCHAKITPAARHCGGFDHRRR